MYFLSRCSVLETPKKPVSAVIAVIVRQGFSRPSVPPNGSHKCLRFGLWPTLCTLKDLSYLLNYLHNKNVTLDK